MLVDRLFRAAHPHLHRGRRHRGLETGATDSEPAPARSTAAALPAPARSPRTRSAVVAALQAHALIGHAHDHASSAHRARADPTQSGSVIASVTRRSTLSGPTISTVGRIRGNLPDDEAGRRLTFDRRHDRHDARRRRLEADRHRRRRHLRHRHGERRLDAFGRQMKQPPARLRRAEIDRRHEIAGRRCGPAHRPCRARGRRPIPAAARPSRDSREGSAARAECGARARPTRAATTPSSTAAPRAPPTRSSARCAQRGGTRKLISSSALSRTLELARRRTAPRSCRRARC